MISLMQNSYWIVHFKDNEGSLQTERYWGSKFEVDWFVQVKSQEGLKLVGYYSV